MTTKTDLTRIAGLLAADLDSLSEWEMARLVSDPGLIVQERQTGLRYAQEAEEMDAVAWLRDGNTLVLWAGNDADPDMNWPVEIPVPEVDVSLAIGRYDNDDANGTICAWCGVVPEDHADIDDDGHCPDCLTIPADRRHLFA